MASFLLRQLHQPLPRFSLQHHTRNLTLSTRMKYLYVTPKVSLFDQKVHTKVQGLPANTKVTLQARTQQTWRQEPVVFTSCGHYVSSGEGTIDLCQDASTGGTYTGLDPMGLFWSMRPCPSGPQNIRMVVRNGDHPVLYTLSLYLGHWSLPDLAAQETTLTPVYSTTVTRLKKAADVRRIPVKEGGVRGVLFLPPGEGPHPGVIDMYGAAGGLMETRSSLLASHGFAVLALPLFKYEDLPETYEGVTFDYFEESASWFSSHTAVKKEGIGVVGTSKGGEKALLITWKCPQVKAVVTINSVCCVTFRDMRRKDGTLIMKAAKHDKDEAKTRGLNTLFKFNATAKDFIPVWETRAHVLMNVCDDDMYLNQEMVYDYRGCYPEDKRHLVEIVHYPGAGHLLDPPYTPHCKACFFPFMGKVVPWGGNPADQAAAQESAWKRILAFFQTHLG